MPGKKRKKGERAAGWPLPPIADARVQVDLRANGARLLLELCDAARGDEWVRTLEENVYVYAKDSDARYAEKIKQLVFNLRSRPDLQRLAPEVLVALDDAELGRGTASAAWNASYAAHKKVEQTMRAADAGVPAAAGAFFRCRNCKSTNVSHEQKQTRSADEGMTIFLHCKDCDKRWKA